MNEREELSLKIKQLSTENTKLTQNFLASNGISKNSIKKYFGTLNGAKVELGISVMQNKNVSKEEAISKILYLNNKYGYFSKGLLESLSIKDEPMLINSKTITRIWGSFNSMYQEVPGINRSQSGIIKSDEELLNSLKILNKTYGYVNSWINNKFGKYCYDSYILRWGSFDNACRIANVNYKNYDKWTSEEAVIVHIENILSSQAIRQKQFKWLKYNENNRSNMRVDAYFEDLNLIVEYNGVQHYEHCKFFHNTEKAFEESKARDLFKYQKIKEKDINLIIHKYSDSLDILHLKLEELTRNGLYHDPF